ncbi:unnamed protein product [Spirodela intermedia]|uniref:Pectinesterase n=1 Tax=Spirodela intermedia TaxID=51605 RepID=A0A7I8KB66_SPIIN|nr:unnamed protein product [Spirodela intermedia]
MAYQQPMRLVLTVAPPQTGDGGFSCPLGDGVYPTVQDAIDAVPLRNTVRTTIVIPPGVYRQPLSLLLSLLLQPSRVIGTGTFGCGSTIVEGEDFIAENITFENSAPQGSGQAVAVRVTADRCAFYNCRFLGWQVRLSSSLDTLYLHHGKQYLKDCYIEGSVDFIFGNSTSQGFITAQSRKSAQEPTGYIFLRCVITGNGSSAYASLGRPWGPFARVLYAYTWMDSCIKPAGWHNWDKPENERSACFFDLMGGIFLLFFLCRCSGPGSCQNERVPWCRELDEEEAEQLLMHTFIDPDNENPWLAQRMSTKIPLSV